MDYTNGKEAIWVGSSDQISQGHIVVPIEWDRNTKIYTLKPTIHVDKVRVERVIYQRPGMKSDTGT